MTKPDLSSARAVGRSILGPLYWAFCSRLHVFQGAYAGRNGVALYVARGGLRLHQLYEIYLRRQHWTPQIPQQNLFLSRLAACKGCLVTDFEHVAPIMCREFNGASLTDMIQAVTPELRSVSPEALNAQMPASLKGAKAAVPSFSELFHSTSPIGNTLREVFTEQGDLFADYIKSRYQDENLLVDTGWSGTAQLMLARRFSEKRWMGLYVGKWNTRGEHLPQFRYMVGLTVDQTTMPPNAPGWAVFDYHHIIEAPLEIDMPSTEGYQRLPDGTAAAWPTPPDEYGRIADNGDELWAGINDYFHAIDPAQPLSVITANKKRALHILARKIRNPRLRDVKVLCVPPRSADFGKKLKVPVLLPVEQETPLSQKIWRTRHALWRQGQLRLEFPYLAGFLCACYNKARRIPHVRRKSDAIISRFLAKTWQRRNK